jgi:hypothetical protein
MTPSKEHKIIEFLKSRANWGDSIYYFNKGSFKVPLKAGQCVTTQAYLERRFGVSRSQIRTFFKNNFNLFNVSAIKDLNNRNIGSLITFIASQQTPCQSEILGGYSQQIKEALEIKQQIIENQSKLIDQLKSEKEALQRSIDQQVEKRVVSLINKLREKKGKQAFTVFNGDKEQYQKLLNALRPLNLSNYEINGIWIRHNSDLKYILDLIEYTNLKHQAGKVQDVTKFFKAALNGRYDVTELYRIREKQQEVSLREQEEKIAKERLIMEELEQERVARLARVKEDQVKLWVSNNKSHRIFVQYLDVVQKQSFFNTFLMQKSREENMQPLEYLSNPSSLAFIKMIGLYQDILKLMEGETISGESENSDVTEGQISSKTPLKNYTKSLKSTPDSQSDSDINKLIFEYDTGRGKGHTFYLIDAWLGVSEGVGKRKLRLHLNHNIKQASLAPPHTLRRDFS